MTEETRLQELLSLWQRRREQGRPAAPGELCRDCPELLPDLEARIRALERAGQPAAQVYQTAVTPPLPSDTHPDESRGEHPAPAVPGYEILEELGRGGMGVVYKARDLRLNRLVAIKMALAGARATDEGRARFGAEAEAVARLEHPHIVRVLTSGEHQGQPYFVMEYVEGGGLDRQLQGRPQPPGDAARLVMLLARAVHAAHQRGLVHRDLKPANILLAPPADEPALNTAYGCPRITDFGLVKWLNESPGQTAHGVVLGTPRYMAPEQARGDSRAIGPATDVYALGAILYELLTGRVASQREDLPPTSGRSHGRTPESAPTLRVGLPPALEAVCRRCLAERPRERYPTAAELANDLERFLRGEGVLAPPPRPRWPLVLAGALVAVAALGVTLGALIWGRLGRPAGSATPPPGAQGTVPAPPAPGGKGLPQPAAKPPAGWKEYRNAEGGFAVWLPGIPREVKRRVPTAEGEVEMREAALRDTATGLHYSVTCGEFLGITLGDPEARLNAARDGALRKVEGKLLRERPVRLGKYPGRELQIELPRGKGVSIRLRMYLVGQRYYQLLVGGTKETVQGKDAGQFLGSLRLLAEP
jgi:tRNA A-37 threonylcarbamoyl transferase component Bud32